MREEVLVDWNPWWNQKFELDYVERELYEKIEKWSQRKNI